MRVGHLSSKVLPDRLLAYRSIGSRRSFLSQSLSLGANYFNWLGSSPLGALALKGAASLLFVMEANMSHAHVCAIERHPASDQRQQQWRNPVEIADDESANELMPMQWDEIDIVELHWRLLLELRHLADPEAPLEGKLDTLRWIFTESEKDKQPFSFVQCIQVVGCSPLSSTIFFGKLDVESIRDWVQHHVTAWLVDTLKRYPAWVRDAVIQNPEWVEERLAVNPQWINEQIRVVSLQGDLFASN